MSPASRSLVALGALAVCFLCGCAQEPPRRPNVLLITLDTTRADRLGSYGHPGNLTPGLDRVAAEGARFAFAIATAGLTPMSHASILTGLNPYAHGLRVFHGEVGHRLPEHVPTLPELLAARGYRTAAFVSAYPVSEAYGLERGFERFKTGLEVDALDLTRQQRHETHWSPTRRSSTQRRGDYTTDDALEFVEAQTADQPWLLWLHYFDVHDFSLVPPREYAASQGMQYDPSVTPQNLVAREAMYDLELRWLDLQLQILFDRLRARGDWEHTIVVITSDHGQGLQDGLERHGWALHRLLYQWSLHVPLIVRGPGVPRGVVVDELARTIDVLPTILELTDVPAPEGVEGKSLMSLVRGEERGARIAYADALNTLDSHSPLRRLPPSQQDDLYVVMDRRWKLIHHRLRPEESELYDLERDPLETRNLYAQQPGEVARLRAFLTERDALRLVPAAGSAERPDAARLEALGYVGDRDGD